MAKAKIGSEHVSAMARQGLRELRAAMYPGSNVAQQGEYGLYGTMTPGEVAESRRQDGRDLEDEKSRESVLESRMPEAEASDMGGQDSKPLEMER